MEELLGLIGSDTRGRVVVSWGYGWLSCTIYERSEYIREESLTIQFKSEYKVKTLSSYHEVITTLNT